MSKELRGSCLCNQISYRITGKIFGVLNCHCSMCRKAHGSAFKTRASIRKRDFQWLAGEKLITRYESSPGEYRTFCSICGSNLVTEFDKHPQWYGFALGTLDDDPGVNAECHVFVGSKAPWHDITDKLPQWKAMPED